MLFIYLNDQRISDLPAGNGLVLIHSLAFSISAFRSASFAKLFSLPGDDDSCLVSVLLSIFISLSTRVTGNNNTGIMLAKKATARHKSC